MNAPLDTWAWDAEAQEVVALDVADKHGGDATPVDFTDEPVGILASAAPDMARALLLVLKVAGEGSLFTGGEREVIRAALRKAGVI